MDQINGANADGDTEDLPTYEETLSTTPRKRYRILYPQVISRTVHAIDLDNSQVSYVKRVRGLSSTKTQYYASDRLVWTCRREQNGFELVFTRPSSEPLEEPPPPPPPPPPPAMGEEMEVGSADNLRDNKPTIPPVAEDLAAPPAYQENEALEIRLRSQYPFPFIYEFQFPRDTLRWQRTAEAEGVMFTCVEKSSGRLLAEITSSSTGLGTLVVYDSRQLPF
ncbi:hypothetical protein GGI19_003863 [Coemansia pectinata]|uniref:Uncharacterized protein n=1 Tax=Coemansia pectinata TaxID=1052879 RepID=A0A9W8GZH8_9FUNG|nr:hypothetical protein GGI19_003863 [Coemansia pectinata]